MQRLGTKNIQTQKRAILSATHQRKPPIMNYDKKENQADSEFTTQLLKNRKEMRSQKSVKHIDYDASKLCDMLS